MCPILVQAYPDDLNQFTLDRRRDAFCGKISVCNDLRQYGYAYTLTTRTQFTPSPIASARTWMTSWVSAGWSKACAMLAWARSALVPSNFNTVRYSEKLLQSFRHQRLSPWIFPKFSAGPTV